VYYKVAENCIKPRKNQQKRDILLIPITFIYLITGWDGWGFALYTILFVAVILEYLLEKHGK
jgi:hypothetical protein